MLVYIDAIDFPDGNLMPVHAYPVHGTCYELADSSPDPEHFPWAFDEGDVVQCVEHEFAPGEVGLVVAGPCTCEA